MNVLSKKGLADVSDNIQLNHHNVPLTLIM